MIQRIQTLYLLVASVISGGLIFVFSLWSSGANSSPVFAIDLLSRGILQSLVPVLFLNSAIISFIAIFLFKNRKSQFVLVRSNILNNLILLGILIYLSLTLSKDDSISQKGIGMFLPVIVIFLSVLSNKAIKKDEELVKSVDRLR